MNLLFYDVETSGLPVWDRRSDHPSQPRIVEIAAELTDAQGKMISMMSALIMPDGWSIWVDAIKVHGIENDYARDNGMPIADAMKVFMDMWEQAGMRIAHNQAFDERMVRIELIRLFDREVADVWKDGQKFCTMHSAKSIVGATNAKGAIKTPTLAEAYTYFTHLESEQDHRALGDLLMCKAVYFGLLRYSEEHPEAQEKPAAEVPLFEASEI